jgi:hypothetical protein
MTLGRTSAGKIKIKTDGTAGLRAVECACCEGKCWIQKLYDSGVRSITLDYFGGGFPTGDGACEPTSGCPDFEPYSTQIKNSTGPNGIYVLDYYESSQPSFGTSAQYFAFDLVLFFGCDCSEELIRQPQFWFPYVACTNGGSAWALAVGGGGSGIFSPTATAYYKVFYTPPKNGEVIDGKFSLSW